MATRSRIAVKQGKVWKSVCVHWDGYPDGVGVELLNNYTTEDSIKYLLEIGHRSTLIDDPQGGTGYGDGYDEFETLQDLMETFDQEDTEYLYQVDPSNEDEVGGWSCFSKHSNKEIDLIKIYVRSIRATRL